MTGWLAARDQAFRDRVEIVAIGQNFGERVRRLQDRRHDRAAGRGDGDVPLPRRRSDRGEARPVPPTRPAGHLRAPRPIRGPALPSAPHPADPHRAAHDRQRTRLEAAFAADEHVAVTATWEIYQLIIAAYAQPDPQRGKALLAKVIDTLRAAVPAGLEELATLGRTLHRRRDDVLAYFTHRTSNGPTEAINGRLEALRRNALGFRNMINYRIRSLLHCGALAL